MITDEQVELALIAYQEIEYDACFDDSERCTQHAAMRKALEAAEQAAWQDIETAPRDENLSFLVLSRNCDNGDVITQASWFENELYPDALGSSIDYDDRLILPTHWRHLPEPPRGK